MMLASRNYKADMKIVSLNVSKPIVVESAGKMVSTGIFKTPVPGPLEVRKLNIDGDGQADLTVHGGVDKAVYAYSLDHYPYWEKTLQRAALPHGQFGENLTIAGLNEAECCIGDRWRIGTAEFAITQPRQPCFKLGIRFGDDDMPKRFTQSGLTGAYLKVLREGTIAVGDEVHVLERGQASVSVLEAFRAYMNPASPVSKDVYARALQVQHLAGTWREKFASRVNR
jgi:MOSC domain-containing protein YiiM